jgi:hypothetical protein
VDRLEPPTAALRVSHRPQQLFDGHVICEREGFETVRTAVPVEVGKSPCG